MNDKLTSNLKLFALTLPLGLAACATSGEMEALSARVDQAQATANQAAASSMEASRKSDEALKTANEAKAIAEQTDEKLNRAFEKSMQK